MKRLLALTVIAACILLGTSCTKTENTVQPTLSTPTPTPVPTVTANPMSLNVHVSRVTESEAWIMVWLTDAGKELRWIEYGQTQDYGNTSETSDHGYLYIRNLQPDTMYNFRAVLIGEDGTKFLSPNDTFTTTNVRMLVSATLYPTRISSKFERVTDIGSTLFNDSSQQIIVEKVEVIDNGYVIFEISDWEKDDDWLPIDRALATRNIDSDESASFSYCPWETYEISALRTSLLIKWYCLDTTGAELIVEAKPIDS